MSFYLTGTRLQYPRQEEHIMHFLRCGEAVIHYRVRGLDTGKPVIAFINSLGTDFRIWDAVINARR